MSRLIIALTAVAVLTAVAAPAQAKGPLARIFAPRVKFVQPVAVVAPAQVIVAPQKLKFVQPIVASYSAAYAQPIVAVQPVVQSYCAPAQIVAPVYGQQVIQAQSACFFAR